MLLEIPSFLHIGFVDILDIFLVAILIYTAFRWIRGTSAMNIFIAIIILILIRIIAVATGMKMLSAFMGTVLDVGAIALIVIFQPEIRRFLNRVGRGAGEGARRSFINKLLHRKEAGIDSVSIDEIAKACVDMGEQRTGALIVFPHNDSLEDIVATGDRIDANINKRLIMNIFFKNSPLHDGAMIIAPGRIVAVRCTLPSTERTDIPAHFGMRHKAAIGMSERSDADVLVVSEQTGRISFVRSGVITDIENINSLKLLLGATDDRQQAGDETGLRQNP